jgi:hypothetical protein
LLASCVFHFSPFCFPCQPFFSLASTGLAARLMIQPSNEAPIYSPHPPSVKKKLSPQSTLAKRAAEWGDTLNR